MVDAEPEHVQQIIRRLGLVPHPEGGYFLETDRSECTPMRSKGFTDPDGPTIETARGRRNVYTVIYYLLTKRSPVQYILRNHGSSCVHTFCEGSPLTYFIVDGDGKLTKQKLGPASEDSQPKLTVSKSIAKGARLEAGEYCLLTEVVIPGFDVSDCDMLTLEELRTICADWEQCVGLTYADAPSGGDGTSAAKELYAQDKFYKGVGA